MARKSRKKSGRGRGGSRRKRKQIGGGCLWKTRGETPSDLEILCKDNENENACKILCNEKGDEPIPETISELSEFIKCGWEPCEILCDKKNKQIGCIKLQRRGAARSKHHLLRTQEKISIMEKSQKRSDKLLKFYASDEGGGKVKTKKRRRRHIRRKRKTKRRRRY